MWRLLRPLVEYCRRLLQEAYDRCAHYQDIREERGTKLLREWLSSAQREQFDSLHYFEVIGCDSGTRYRIHYGSAQNVHELDGDGRPRVGWCFTPCGHLVPGDVMLAQKIALETDERAALAVARQFLTVWIGGTR